MSHVPVAAPVCLVLLPRPASTPAGVVDTPGSLLSFGIQGYGIWVPRTWILPASSRDSCQFPPQFTHLAQIGTPSGYRNVEWGQGKGVGSPLLMLRRAERGRGSPGPRYTSLRPQAQPGLCCGSVHTVLHMAWGTGPVGTWDGLCPGDARAAMQQGWGTLPTFPGTRGHLQPPVTAVPMTWWCAMAWLCQLQLLTHAVPQALATHPSFPCWPTPGPGLPVASEH